MLGKNFWRYLLNSPLVILIWTTSRDGAQNFSVIGQKMIFLLFITPRNHVSAHISRTDRDIRKPKTPSKRSRRPPHLSYWALCCSCSRFLRITEKADEIFKKIGGVSRKKFAEKKPRYLLKSYETGWNRTSCRPTVPSLRSTRAQLFQSRHTELPTCV